MTRPVTSTDVARQAGVSQSAVSRAFSPGASIAPATRRKVLEAAAALNYRPNRIPAIMLSGRSRMVGVVVGGLSNPFYASALERLAISLRAEGLQILLVHVDDALTLDSALDHLLSYRVDAVVTALAVGTRSAARALSDMKIPVICFNSRLTGPWISTVVSNNRAAGNMAARVLLECGVKRPAWLAGPVRNTASRARGQGFIEGLRTDSSVSGDLIELHGDDSYESGYDAICKMLAGGARPDGLFSSNDLMACGAMDALRQRGGLRCPEDVVMMGYDNIPQAGWYAYDLTSFDQQAERLVAVATELLETALQPESGPVSRTCVIEAKLVVRRSTTPQFI
ncbi:LacI family DNA-binding transcriptional regulator [Komagataeibacter saccharivorans]|uniref:LacI family DNA-binding transcriptional regulator n=1 Tax=Komagataeibacter saccharivorans TaxID=265959 RepID=UPI003132BA15